MAAKFNAICEERGRTGTFVLLSAEASIISSQQSRRYVDMKREAEQYLMRDCDSLFAAILRPGLVYHDTERPWSMPLGLISNLSHSVTAVGGVF